MTPGRLSDDRSVPTRTPEDEVRLDRALHPELYAMLDDPDIPSYPVEMACEVIPEWRPYAGTAADPAVKARNAKEAAQRLRESQTTRDTREHPASSRRVRKPPRRQGRGPWGRRR